MNSTESSNLTNSTDQNDAAAVALNAEKKRERRPDRAVYVPRARRWQNNSSTAAQTFAEDGTDACLNEHALASEFILHEVSPPKKATNKIKTDDEERKRLKKHEHATKSTTTNNKTKNDKLMKKIANENIAVVQHENLMLEDGQILPQNCDNKNHEKIMPAAAAIVNSTNIANSTIVYETNLSDQFKESVILKQEEPNSPNNSTIKCDTDTAQQQQQQTMAIENQEEETSKQNGHLVNEHNEQQQDDWENMFDDKGECLDPMLLADLTAAMEKTDVSAAKSNCDAFHAKQSILNEEEFPHVLEVSNFPAEFKTPDLLLTFSPYKQSGFEIRWVDETHALAVFSNSTIAAEVLSKRHPFVIVKPLAEASAESRAKAKKCASSLQPYKARPETCAALARRLVTGALGVRLKTDAAQREKERRVLQAAKERKLQAAKCRDEAWES